MFRKGVALADFIISIVDVHAGDMSSLIYFSAWPLKHALVAAVSSFSFLLDRENISFYTNYMWSFVYFEPQFKYGSIYYYSVFLFVFFF